MTRLKKLSPEERAKIFKWCTEENQNAARAMIKDEFGIAVPSNGILSRFCSWQLQQARLENYNSLTDQFEEFYRKANPTASRDKIREAGIAFFMAESMANKDRDGFLSFAYASMKEDTGKTKAQQTERKLNLEERRVAILEQKAKQAEEVEAVTKSDATPEEKQQKIRAIFGMT